MNVKNHFLQRYCERILNMNDNNEIKQYVIQNRERLINDALKMFEYAEHIYTGQLWDNITRNYYIRDNIILVVDSQKTALITLFRIDYGFGDELNRTVVDGLLKNIREKKDLLKLEENKIKDFAEQKEFEIEKINKKIEILERERELLLQNKEVLRKEIEAKKNDVIIAQKEIEKTALLLCSSLDYKKELLEGKAV